MISVNSISKQFGNNCIIKDMSFNFPDTGFYLLLRNTVSSGDAIRLVRQAFGFISEFEGEIPGAKRQECGNYLEHDLPGARRTAADMLDVLKNWNTEKLAY